MAQEIQDVPWVNLDVAVNHKQVRRLCFQELLSKLVARQGKNRISSKHLPRKGNSLLNAKLLQLHNGCHATSMESSVKCWRCDTNTNAPLRRSNTL
jgi:hypothetical protein